MIKGSPQGNEYPAILSTYNPTDGIKKVENASI